MHAQSLLGFAALLSAASLAHDSRSVNTTTTCIGNSSRLDSADCKAWIDFFDKADGSNWKVNVLGKTCKDKRTDPCSCSFDTQPLNIFSSVFNYVRCEGAHITGLIFPQGGLGGTLSASLSHMEQLAALDVSDNSIGGVLPSLRWEQYNNCPASYGALKCCRIDSCAWNCPIPEEAVTHCTSVCLKYDDLPSCAWNRAHNGTATAECCQASYRGECKCESNGTDCTTPDH